MRTILCDMDGVLAWFGVAAALACGRDWKDGAYPDTYHMENDWGLSAEDFWARIDSKGEAFWSEMQPCPWGAGVWALCKKYAERVVILTSPPRAPHAWSGKVKWIQKYYGGPAFRDFILCPAGHKELLAAPGRLLLDDHEDNVDAFAGAHGDALLWPASYNKNKRISQPLIWLESNLRLWARVSEGEMA